MAPSLTAYLLQVMSFWAPPGLQAIGSEAGNKAMADPSARMVQRKTLAPGFSRQALRQVGLAVLAVLALSRSNKAS